jgi:hypothetical protein
VQYVPSGQRLPHAPQLLSSGPTQAPPGPQGSDGLGHRHRPEEVSTQRAPDGQRRPQAPQFCSSDAVHTPLQVSWAQTHRPSAQRIPAPQRRPHAPQLASSPSMNTQTPPQVAVRAISDRAKQPPSQSM